LQVPIPIEGFARSDSWSSQSVVVVHAGFTSYDPAPYRTIINDRNRDKMHTNISNMTELITESGRRGLLSEVRCSQFRVSPLSPPAIDDIDGRSVNQRTILVKPSFRYFPINMGQDIVSVDLRRKPIVMEAVDEIETSPEEDHPVTDFRMQNSVYDTLMWNGSLNKGGAQ